jgi:hypothetical protein
VECGKWSHWAFFETKVISYLDPGSIITLEVGYRLRTDCWWWRWGWARTRYHHVYQFMVFDPGSLNTPDPREHIPDEIDCRSIGSYTSQPSPRLMFTDALIQRRNRQRYPAIVSNLF